MTAPPGGGPEYQPERFSGGLRNISIYIKSNFHIIKNLLLRPVSFRCLYIVTVYIYLVYLQKCAEKRPLGAGLTLTSDWAGRGWEVDLRPFLSIFVISDTCRGNEEDLCATHLDQRRVCVYSSADVEEEDGTNRSRSRCSAAPPPRPRCRW